MTAQQMLIDEIKKAPEPIVKEVYLFFRFLQEKSDDESFDGLALSESALAIDWASKEEDEAWKSL